jgi:hypothetical protein
VNLIKLGKKHTWNSDFILTETNNNNNNNNNNKKNDFSTEFTKIKG